MGIKNFVKSKIHQWLGPAPEKETSRFHKNELLEERYNSFYDPLVGDRFATVELGNFLALYSSHPWVYVAAAAISSAAASVPFQLHHEGDPVEDADEHCPYLNAPNPNITWFDLIEMTFLHLELAGNAYWEIVRDKNTQKVLGIFPLRPDRVKVIPDRFKKVAGYIYNVGNGVIITYAAPEIIHLKYNDAKNEFYGIPPVSALKNDITLDFNATTWNKNFFINGAEPGAVLQTDKSLTEQAYQRLRQTWYKRHKGVDKAHEIAILEEGLKYTAITSKHADMQYYQLKEWTRDIVLSVMRVPPVVVGLSIKLSAGTERDQKKTFWYDNIIPKLLRLQHVLNFFLMPENVEFSFVVKSIDSIIEDDAIKTTIIQSNIAHGVMTINEAREKYYNMLPLGWGDTWWRPIGLVDVQNPVPVQMPNGTNTDAEKITNGGAAGLNSPNQVPQVGNSGGQDNSPQPSNKSASGKPKLQYETPKPKPKKKPKKPATMPNQDMTRPPRNQPFLPNDARIMQDEMTPSADRIDARDQGFDKNFIEIEKLVRPEPNWDNPKEVNDYQEWSIWKATAGPDDRKIRKLFKNFFADQGNRVKSKVEKGWPFRKDDITDSEEVNAARDVLILSFLFDMETENEILHSVFAPVSKAIFKKYGNMLMNQLDADLSFSLKEPAVLDFLANHAAQNVTMINETTRELLKTQLLEAYKNEEGIKDILARVTKVFDGDVSIWRANRIARTELGVLVNNGRFQAAIQSGVVKKKRWVCALLPTSRERAGGENHVEMHDTVVDLMEPFNAPKRRGGFDKMMHPGDMSAHPENLVHCFCYASYSAGTPEFDDINLGKKETPAPVVIEKVAEKVIEDTKQEFNITVNVQQPNVTTEVKMAEQKAPIVNVEKGDAPIVNVTVEKPDPTIVNVAPPDVKVNVEKADAPQVHVHVERQIPPTIHVHTPENKVPDVHVHNNVSPTPVSVNVEKPDAPIVHVEVNPEMTIPTTVEETIVHRGQKNEITGSTKITKPKKD